MTEPAIHVENLSKLYHIGLAQKRNDTLRDLLVDTARNIGRRFTSAPRSSEDELWALRDVSFEVQTGEVVGIMGPNGAGKSTLLKILSRITEPTSGRVVLNGRVGALLEVGTGFHPELTGRENIYLNGAILGMQRKEIERKFDEIVAFSGIERFLDTPVKRYSSGMYVRLAFSVAAHLDPEILVVDEVLAVGDAEFQKKCLGKMSDVAGEGRTVLFVSHNMAALRNLCPTAVYMKNGKIIKKDSTEQVINDYLSTAISNSETPLPERTDRKGNGNAKISKIIINSDGQINSTVLMHQPVSFDIYIDSIIRSNDAEVVLALYNQYQVNITSTSTKIASQDKFHLKLGNNKISCKFDSLPLQKGTYFVNVLVKYDSILSDWVEQAIKFNVVEDDIFGTGKVNYGTASVVNLHNCWDQEK